jgi:threonine aldolase
MQRPDQHARGFASDNHAGVHPEVLEAIVDANRGHAESYGGDSWTARAEQAFREHFGTDVRVFGVFNGTGANVAAIDAVTGPHEAVICTEVAHMYLEECGAPERLAGTKLLPVPAPHGKLTVADVSSWEAGRGAEHHAQPRLVSITQSTERGTVYSVEETRAIAEAAHGLGMYLHVDGARAANAAAALGEPLAALTTDAGVDVLSFGGTKNGLLFGEAVVFCNAELAERFAFTRKQLGQLASKMRFVSAQLTALLTEDLWLRNARHANRMAARLAEAVESLAGVQVVHPVQANAVFAQLGHGAIERLLASSSGTRPFHVWDESTGLCRWMCSWDTEPRDVDEFAAAVAAAVRA